MPDAPLDDVAIDDLVSEYLAQRRRGERVSVDEFARQHPHWESEIRRLLPAALALERVGRRRKENSAAPASCAGELPADTRLGDFVLLEEIGHGGMGVVYKARQTSLGRIVAVKVLRVGAMAVEKHARRFEREAQAAARLHHTNIVPVFGVGHQDGIHYYVMQLIEGEGLDHVIAELGRIETVADAASETITDGAGRADDGRPPRVTVSEVARVLLGGSKPAPHVGRRSTLHAHADATGGSSPSAAHRSQSAITVGDRSASDGLSGQSNATSEAVSSNAPGPAARSAGSLNRQYWRSVARIGLEAARALEYAHSQGTLHRDVKPGNLIVDRRGTVWITDFGLAKLLHNDSLTETGDVVGTLRYMSPEQFRGQADGRSDVYGLGVTLYELAALRPAFDATARAGLLDQILRQEPPRPRKLRPTMPGDLETIILKSISREPNHRYQTSRELADDLERFLDDRPIHARRVGPIERFWRWCRRNPATAIPTAAAALLLALACALATGAYLRELNLRATAEFQTARAEQGLSQAEAQRRVADTQRLLAEENFAKAQTEEQRAQQHLNAAQRQQRRAEANLALALQAFEEVFERIAPSGVPRTTEDEASDESYEPAYQQAIVSVEDAALLESMLSFYDRFAEENTTNRKLQSEAAKAHRRVGDIHHRLGQLQEAETAYLRALALYRRLDQENSDETRSYQTSVAQLLNELGQVQKKMYPRGEEAQQSHREALAILDEMHEQSPDSPEITLELIRTHHLLVDAIWGWHRHDSDEDAHLYVQTEPISRKAFELVGELIASDPENPEYQLMLARSNRDLFPGAGRRRESSEATLKAIGILDKLVEEYPAVPLYRYELVCTLSHRDKPLWNESGVTETSRRFERAIELARVLSEEFPLVPEYANRYAFTCYKYGHLLGTQDLDNRAETMFRKCVELRREQSERFADVPQFRLYHAGACGRLADMLRKDGNLTEARDLLNESIGLLIDLEAMHQIHFQLMLASMLSQHHFKLGTILKAQGDDQAAAQAFETSNKYRLAIHPATRSSPSSFGGRGPQSPLRWRRNRTGSSRRGSGQGGPFGQSGATEDAPGGKFGEGRSEDKR